MAEIARTLKPGGDFVFDVSFPNSFNPTNFPPRLKPQRTVPLTSSSTGRGEVDAILVETGLAAKAGGLGSSPARYAILPKRVGSGRCRSCAGESGSPIPARRFEGLLAETFLASSPGVAA